MSRNSNTAADKARDKALRDADRESRIVDFLSTVPDDMEPSELECAIIAIANAYMPDEVLPNFFLYLSLRIKGLELSTGPDVQTH